MLHASKQSICWFVIMNAIPKKEDNPQHLKLIHNLFQTHYKSFAFHFGENRTQKMPLHSSSKDKKIKFELSFYFTYPLRQLMARCSTVRHGRVRDGTLRHGTLRNGTEYHGPERHDAVRYGTVRYATARIGQNTVEISVGGYFRTVEISVRWKLPFFTVKMA